MGYQQSTWGDHFSSYHRRKVLIMRFSAILVLVLVCALVADATFRKRPKQRKQRVRYVERQRSYYRPAPRTYTRSYSTPSYESYDSYDRSYYSRPRRTYYYHKREAEAEANPSAVAEPVADADADAYYGYYGHGLGYSYGYPLSYAGLGYGHGYGLGYVY